jgi:hypothetical protein
MANKYADMADPPEGTKSATKPAAKPAPRVSKYAKMADDYDPSWSEVWQGAKENLGQGVVNFGKAVGDAYRSPIDAAYNVATGALNLEEALQATPENAVALAKGVKAVAQDYAKNYGSLRAAKLHAMREPYAVAMDALTFAPVPGALGGAIAKGASKVVPAGVKAAAKVAGSAAAKGAAKVTPTIVKNALASTPAKAAGHLAAAAVHPMRAVNKVAAKAVEAAPGVARGIENVYNAKLGFVGNVTGGVDNARNIKSILDAHISPPPRAVNATVVPPTAGVPSVQPGVPFTPNFPQRGLPAGPSAKMLPAGPEAAPGLYAPGLPPSSAMNASPMSNALAVPSNAVSAPRRAGLSTDVRGMPGAPEVPGNTYGIEYGPRGAVPGGQVPGTAQSSLPPIDYALSPGEIVAPQMVAPRFAALSQVTDAQSLTGGLDRQVLRNEAVDEALHRAAPLRGDTITPLDARLKQAIDITQTNKEAGRNAFANQWMQVTPNMQELFDVPLVAPRIQSVRDIAATDRVPFSVSAATDYPAGLPAGPRAISGAMAERIKKALDDYSSYARMPSSGLSPDTAGSVTGARNSILADVDAAISDYAKYRQQFGVDRRMEDQIRYLIGARDALRKPLTGEATLTPNAEAFAKYRQTAIGENQSGIGKKKSTGGDYYPGGERDLLTPEGVGYLDDAQNAMAAGDLVKQQAASLKGSLPDVNNVLSNAMGGGHPRWWTTVLAGNQDDRIAAEIVASMRTPEGASEMLGKYLGREATLAERRMFFDRVVAANRYNPLRVMNNNPALFNAFGQRDQQEQAR